MTINPESIAWPESPGLIPAVVQDRADGRVLMLAWVDREALDATLATGEVHFHSRSRDRLWRKGESSGNVLRLVSIAQARRVTGARGAVSTSPRRRCRQPPAARGSHGSRRSG
jgi:hypothetical protein